MYIPRDFLFSHGLTNTHTYTQTHRNGIVSTAQYIPGSIKKLKPCVDSSHLTVDHGLHQVAHLGHADLDVEALALLRDEVHRAVVLLFAENTTQRDKAKHSGRNGGGAKN